MSKLHSTGESSRLRVTAAFAAIYIFWGSTYLAIRFAIETIPPFLMASMRFLIAGAVLYVWARLRGASRPANFHWKGAAIVSGLLLLGGNGGVVWAEQRVPSGLTALLVGMVPLWMVLLDWFRHEGSRPRNGVMVGLLLGLIGIILLVGPGELMGSSHVDLMGVAVLVIASLSWAIGSLYSRQTQLPPSPLLATAMEMLAGGALLLLAGLVTGEWKSFNLEALSLRSIISLGYLIVFGSLLGFTAYIWLLGVRTSAKVSTYAYVNPVVAIFIGWAIGGEALTARTLLAAAIIVTAVVVITTQRGRRSTQKDERTSADRKILARPDAKIKIRRIPQLLDEDRI